MRWRGKLSLMKQWPTKSDQLTIVIEGCVLMLSRKLRDLGIRNFEELHKFGVQKESDLAQDKKFFSGRTSGREGIGSSNMVGLSHNVQINAIREPRKFSNLGRPLFKVLKKLVENNLIHPLPQRPPFPNVNPKYYSKYHQSIGHDTDGYIRLKHKVQDHRPRNQKSKHQK